MTQLLTQNSKLKKTSKHFGKRVFNFGIPAYKSVTGKITCPFADECVKFCYARKGTFKWPKVINAYEYRYELSKTDKFIPHINAEIILKSPDYIRIHDSGDYYSRAYLDKWLAIAIHNPQVRFYSYTNCVEMLKNVELPDNFDVIFSDSGKQKHLIDQKQDRHTKIFDTLADLLDQGYKDTSDYDLNATKWFNDTNKVGLVKH